MKDPAMLWYWNDWGGGTRTLSRFLKGCYIDLLEAQFNSGPLSLEEIKTVLGADFGQSWPTLSKKFKTTEMGLFFNERMEVEKAKRSAYSESRRSNRKKKSSKKEENEHVIKDMKNTCSTYVPHMDNENRNINEIKEKGVQGEKQKKTFSIPTIDEVKDYCIERKNSVDPVKWYNFYQAKGWMIGKNKMKDWKAAVITWEKPNNSENAKHKTNSSGNYFRPSYDYSREESF